MSNEHDAATGSEYDELLKNRDWWVENYWRQIRRLHKAYANLGCVDEKGSAMNYTGDVGPKNCTCDFCAGHAE